LKKLAIIAAVSENGVIGKDGGLPWHIPEDLKYFKANTTGHAIIMGRKTYDSIGRPLPKRRNIVVTRNAELRIEGVEVVTSLEAAIELARSDDEEPRIIGGASLYRDALPLATRLFLTRVQRTVEGDTYFPDFDEDEWEETQSQVEEGFVFQVLQRVGKNET
jgi:dihydrofolate reductase